MKMEQVHYLKTTEQVESELQSEIQIDKSIASTSSASTFINDSIMTDEHAVIEQRSLRCYQPGNLYLNISMEEEDIMDWVHLEPSVQQRAPTPLPSNKNAESTKKKFI
jgi:hypothetical protein